MFSRHPWLVVTLALVAALVAPIGTVDQARARVLASPAMVIEFRADVADTLDLAASFGGRMTAYADGVECATAILAPSGGALALGLPGQREACSRVGAVVTVIDGRNFPLGNQIELQPGATVRLTQYLIYPPHGGPMVVRVVAADEVAFDAARDHRITAHADDGTACASVTLEAPVVLLLVGLPDQPEPCQLQGEFVTFRDAHGRPFLGATRHVQATVGLTYTAADAPPPAGQPVPPAAGLGATPASGGGIADVQRACAVLAVLLGTLVVIVWRRGVAAR